MRNVCNATAQCRGAALSKRRSSAVRCSCATAASETSGINSKRGGSAFHTAKNPLRASAPDTSSHAMSASGTPPTTLRRRSDAKSSRRSKRLKPPVSTATHRPV